MLRFNAAIAPGLSGPTSVEAVNCEDILSFSSKLGAGSEMRYVRKEERTPFVLSPVDVLETCGSSFSSGLPPGQTVVTMVQNFDTVLNRPAKTSKRLKVWERWQTRSTSSKGSQRNILPMLKTATDPETGVARQVKYGPRGHQGWLEVSHRKLNFLYKNP